MTRAISNKSGASPSALARVAMALTCGAALAFLACAASPPGGASGDGAPKGIADSGPPSEGSTPDIQFQQGSVILDGNVLDRMVPGKLEKVQGLFQALLSRGERWRGDGVRTYTLTIQGQVDGAQMKSIVLTAAAAGWPVAHFTSGASAISLHSGSYPLVGAPGAPAAIEWPGHVLTIVIRAGTVELWRVPQVKFAVPGGAPHHKPESEPVLPSSSQPQPEVRAQSLATLKAENLRTEIESSLDVECKPEKPCTPAILFVSDDASVAAISQSIDALATIATKRGQLPLVELRVDEPVPDSPPPNARVGATTVSGRLAPAVIQKVVRGNFGAFRLCYEQGLVRNPELTGKVSVRFVIDREGKVSAAGVDSWQSSMPDAGVTQCIVDQLKSTVFPPPEGGIVTVVYPIMFSPGY